MGISMAGTKLSFDGHAIACLQGDFDIERVRDVKEKLCSLSGDTRKTMGNIKYSDMSFVIPKGEAGNAAAEAALQSKFEANELVAFELEDSDKPTGGTNGSTVKFNCYVVKDVVSYKADDDLEFGFTITVDGAVTKIAAA